MTDAEKIKYLISRLKVMAANTTRIEEYGTDYTPSMYENNAEDGYYAGVADGETHLARELLATLED
jgi:hypothetical protein